MYSGLVNNAISAYHEFYHKRSSDFLKFLENDDLCLIGGNEKVIITKIIFRPQNEDDGFFSGEKATLTIEYLCHEKVKNCFLFIGFLRYTDQLYVGEFNSKNYLSSDKLGLNSTRIELDDSGTLKISIDNLLLLNDNYSFWIILYGDQETYCEYKNVNPFRVSRKNNSIMSGDALFWHPAKIEHIKSK